MRCPHLMCRDEVSGITGLLELQAFISHFKVKHKENLNMEEAQFIRGVAEKVEDEKKYTV